MHAAFVTLQAAHGEQRKGLGRMQLLQMATAVQQQLVPDCSQLPRCFAMILGTNSSKATQPAAKKAKKEGPVLGVKLEDTGA